MTISLILNKAAAIRGFLETAEKQAVCCTQLLLLLSPDRQGSSGGHASGIALTGNFCFPKKVFTEPKRAPKFPTKHVKAYAYSLYLSQYTFFIYGTYGVILQK